MVVVQPLGLAPAGSTHTPVPLGLALVVLWGAGAAGFFCWHLVAHARFCRRMLAGRVREAVADDGIRVVETDAATGPLAFGVLPKYIPFPRDFAEPSHEDARHPHLAPDPRHQYGGARLRA